MCCPNLRELFGSKYRVWREVPHVRDLWNDYIPCRLGHICCWGPGLLAACTNPRHWRIDARLKELDFVTVVQDGSDGVNVTFPVERFDNIAEIMRPKMRRILSEEHKRELVDRLEEARRAQKRG